MGNLQNDALREQHAEQGLYTCPACMLIHENCGTEAELVAGGYSFQCSCGVFILWPDKLAPTFENQRFFNMARARH